MTASRVSPASSTRSKAVFFLAFLALTGCFPAGRADQTETGSALATDSAQSSGVVGNEDAQVGQIWYFALPVPFNKSPDTIEITEVAVEHVPAGLKILKYGAYDLNDTEGLPLLVSEGEKYTPKFEQLKNYASGPVEVPAEQESTIFYLAKLQITSPPQGTARDCRFDYTQGGKAYSQTLDCEVELKVAQ
ncbi:hypothetical protein [Streptomyces sp. NPDC090994]|uniref:hypothetical protein n=1 Tax=Streptomyces sp. NPDC090994 TaxID=3365969 RepID=UPI003812EBF1